MKKLIKIFLFVSLIAILPNAICIETKTEDAQPVEISASIFKLNGNVFINNTKATLGARLNKQDFIETKRGQVTLELSNTARVTIKDNSKVKLDSLKESNIEINQLTGSTFSKVTRKGVNYKIISPTMVAGVRGTTFQVEVANGRKTTIKLLEGKVIVYRVNDVLNQDKLLYLEEGDKVSILEDKVEEPKKLSLYEKVDLIKQDTRIDIQEQEVKTIKKAMTLEDIKNKYGKIARVFTKDGKEYVGYFSQTGDTMTVITVNGNVKIPVANVKSVVPVS